MIESIIQECLVAKKEGAGLNDLIPWIKSQGFTITESMKIIMGVYGISLGEAKRVVVQHPVWSDIVEASLPLHDEIENGERRPL